MTIIASLLSDVWPAIAAIVATLAGVWGLGAAKKRQGRKQAENEANADSLKRQKRGRDEVADLSGAGRDEYIDSLRNNEGRWK